MKAMAWGVFVRKQDEGKIGEGGSCKCEKEPHAGEEICLGLDIDSQKSQVFICQEKGNIKPW